MTSYRSTIHGSVATFPISGERSTISLHVLEIHILEIHILHIHIHVHVHVHSHIHR